MATNSFIAVLTTVVNKCRDILRREGITGMDSMKHLSLYTLVRFIDEEECIKLDVPSKFAWERFIEFTDSSDNHQASYNLLYCKNGATEDLISYFDSLFGTKNFNYKLQSPTSHVEIINEFKKLDLKHLEGKIDVLGSIYEIHLGTGSNKSAMRDLGQFFTERSICKYMVGLCDPKILPDGRAESILDPTMGTGGFLTSYIQHLGSAPKWSEMQDDIAGCDIDEFVMAVGRINLYLQTGIVFNRIIHRDSLKNDIGEDSQRRKFKNILANMPFGVKGLKYKDCCVSVKALGIDGTKSEPLFLQLMMASLDDGGRCAVVVPDGAIVNQSKCHNLTRKYLLDHFEVKRVIKIKGQFFSNTGIQPSILFFENTGKSTSVTEFWEVEKNSAGTVTDRLVVSVPREKIETDSYSLDMRRYIETDALKSRCVYPTEKLGDILVDCIVKKPVSTKSAIAGNYALYSSSCDVFSHNTFEFPTGEYILQGSRGTIANATHYSNGNFSASNNVFVKKTSRDDVDLKFVYYSLKISRVTDSVATTSVIPMLTKTMFDDISIVLPPLEIQKQIVSDLDSIYNNAYNASRMAESVKTQMTNMMKSLMMRGYQMSNLIDLCSHSNGKTLSKVEKEIGGDFQVMGGGMDYIGKYSIFNRDGQNITISKSGASAGFVKFHTGKFWAGDCFTLTPNNDSLDIQFLYYYLKLNPTLTTSHTTGTTIPHCKWDDINKISIPIPPSEIQQKIINILNDLETERKSLEHILSRADERAKFILEQFLG